MSLFGHQQTHRGEHNKHVRPSMHEQEGALNLCHATWWQARGQESQKEQEQEGSEEAEVCLPKCECSM